MNDLKFEDLEITGKNGKTYKGIRGLKIAMGHTVRNALLKFLDEIEEFCQQRMQEFYDEYDPDNYDRTYGLLHNMQIGQLIKFRIKGQWEGKGSIEIDPFDWQVLETRFNGYGKYNTYMSTDGLDNRSDMEDLLADGIIGHDEFEIRKEVQKFIDDNLEDRIEKAIREFV